MIATRLRARGRGSGAHQNGSTRVRSDSLEAEEPVLAERREPEIDDMDDNDYFDELDSPSLISTDKKYAGDFDMEPKEYALNIPEV